MYLLTHLGTFLYLDEAGRLSHRPLHSVAGPGELLEIDVPSIDAGAWFRRAMVNDREQETIVLTTGSLAGSSVHLLSDRRTLALSTVEGGYFSVLPAQVELADNRVLIAGWETFVCLTRQDILDLQHILANDWTINSVNQLARRDVISLEADYQLKLGVLSVSLRFGLPFSNPVRAPLDDCVIADPVSAGSLLSLAVLVDGWRIDQIHLYKPLIFLTVFKAPQYIEQALLLLDSLAEFGKYSGRIHLITDQAKEIFLPEDSKILDSQLTVQNILAQDWVGYVASKYCILECRDAWLHQPVVFLDTDIIADADITPMLTKIAASPRVMAPLEDFSTLARHQSVGASLIQRADGRPRFARGFNGGTLGIPNLTQHGSTLDIVRSIIGNQIELHGRDEFRWVDQEVINYVSFAYGNFDTHTLLQHVRFGWEFSEHDATRRQGLVHFFPPRGNVTKNAAMKTYVETLRLASRPIEEPAPTLSVADRI